MSDSYSATDPAAIPGPFLFAWVDSSETVFGESHWREDEEIVAWNIEHSEGDFPTLAVTIRNPRIGLLAPGRPVWAWFAYNRGWKPEAPIQETSSDSEAFGSEGEPVSEAPDVLPLFFGRLIAVPENLQEELITLNFVARPEDFNAQKEIVAATKRVAPYWDGIWFAPENRYDPDNVLESRPELWHIDRTSLDVSTSSIITGEDGTHTISEDAIIYETMQMSFDQAPLRRVDVVADVSWNQTASGNGLDFSEYCAFGSGHSILTFTGDGLVASWPKPGQSLSGGWYVAAASAERIDGIGGAIWGFGLRNNPGANAGVSANPFGRSYMATDEFHDAVVPSWMQAQTIASVNFPAKILGIPRWRIKPTLVLGFDTSRKKSERLTFSLEADVQAVLTEPGDEEALLLTFTSSEVASPVDPAPDSESDNPQFALPIGRASNRVYFSSPRGTDSLEYLIAVARARLLARSRCVNIDFEIPFETGIALNLSCRKNIVLEDGRLPGGVAGGKITSYSLSCDGDTGELRCSIAIGATVGKGATVEAIEGDPTYVEDGYVDRPYQFYSNEFVMPIAGEIVYETIEGLGANDDGIDFDSLTPAHVFISMVKSGSHTEQKAAMGASGEEPHEIFKRLNEVPTTFALTLKPVNGGPFETLFPVAMSQLMVPKTIDLEAESTT